ncbi:hypothetical protein EYZ11_002387 [Aspergillus tanneri]|uniref:Uncharacterized protein n=1 Tax=Aspergillus tanneri TaxID=1220188 RepID=A0A4S3JQY0_9EURO|nr:uncharacterized protein ATNIH1004_001497 [Aspergillus tanneri]KAA8652592.1 hypothetical protein ATNIH1004_001497 [Aspergillus tanneri]THC98163.1 hypothetical protein EYZ11_002387 [Aspergillus tanneri]
MPPLILNALDSHLNRYHRDRPPLTMPWNHRLILSYLSNFQCNRCSGYYVGTATNQSNSTKITGMSVYHEIYGGERLAPVTARQWRHSDPYLTPFTLSMINPHEVAG